MELELAELQANGVLKLVEDSVSILQSKLHGTICFSTGLQLLSKAVGQLIQSRTAGINLVVLGEG